MVCHSFENAIDALYWSFIRFWWFIVIAQMKLKCIQLQTNIKWNELGFVFVQVIFFIDFLLISIRYRSWYSEAREQAKQNAIILFFLDVWNHSLSNNISQVERGKNFYMLSAQPYHNSTLSGGLFIPQMQTFNFHLSSKKTRNTQRGRARERECYYLRMLLLIAIFFFFFFDTVYAHAT